MPNTSFASLKPVQDVLRIAGKTLVDYDRNLLMPRNFFWKRLPCESKNMRNFIIPNTFSDYGAADETRGTSNDNMHGEQLRQVLR